MDKILLIHARFGEGHKRAAESLETVLGVKSQDLLDFCPGWIKTIYSSSYYLATEKMPFLWKRMFVSSQNKVFLFFLEAVHRIIFYRFYRFVIKNRPQVIVTTHFFVPHLASLIRKVYPVKIISIVTDFRAHPLWAHKQVDWYFTSHQMTNNDLAALGVPKEKMQTGYACLREGFLTPIDSCAVRKSFNLDEKPCVVFMSSVRGNIPHLNQVLPQLCLKYNVLVLCGRNDSLRTQLELLRLPSLRALGFYEKVWEIFEIATVIVSKPGGLTCFEGICKKKPFVFTHFIAGQEEGNMSLLDGLGVGKFAKNSKELVENIDYFISRSLQITQNYPIAVNDIRPALLAKIQELIK